jgi:hypothetical protein
MISPKKWINAELILKFETLGKHIVRVNLISVHLIQVRITALYNNLRDIDFPVNTIYWLSIHITYLVNYVFLNVIVNYSTIILFYWEPNYLIISISSGIRVISKTYKRC